jgi:hypothetical protein
MSETPPTVSPLFLEWGQLGGMWAHGARRESRASLGLQSPRAVGREGLLSECSPVFDDVAEMLLAHISYRHD